MLIEHHLLKKNKFKNLIKLLRIGMNKLKLKNNLRLKLKLI